MSFNQRVPALLLSVVLLMMCMGCPRPQPPKEAIGLSNTVYDFELNTLPYNMTVWNTNASIGPLTISITTDRPWLKTNVSQVTSSPPSGGETDQQAVTVTINRSLLTAGRHEGTVRFSALGVVTKTLTVRVTQDQTNTGQTLSIVNPVFTYRDPYLVDMHFSLKDALGRSVVAEPVQFELTALEGATEVDPLLNGLQIQRGAARQFRAHLVLDYSLSMQSVTGAIAAMEDAAKNTLLPALNEDALVGVWEFHRDDADPQQVAPFSVDRAFLREQIDTIQPDIVHGFPSGSRAWDALLAAALDFTSGNPEKESRYIILFSNGNDTSSIATVNQVVTAARARGIRIYAVAFGSNVNITALQDITSRTGGVYFPTQDVSEINDVFTAIVRDLDGQYNVRWASLKRGTTGFFPSFSLEVNNGSVNFSANQEFVPNTYAGDPLRGLLRLEPSDNALTTTVFLRAVYVPRFISELHLLVRTFSEFSVQLVGPANDGLMSDWTMDTEADEETGGLLIHLESNDGEPLQFATFGPILRFQFDAVSNDPAELFATIEADNTVYPNQQYFVVEGFTD